MPCACLPPATARPDRDAPGLPPMSAADTGRLLESAQAVEEIHTLDDDLESVFRYLVEGR